MQWQSLCVATTSRVVFAACLFAGECHALAVDSGPVSIPVPAISNGAYLNLVTGDGASINWDFHPYADSNGMLNFLATGSSTVVAAASVPTLLGEAMVVGPSSPFAAAGALAATAFRAGVTTFVGVRFVDEASGQTNYGYVEIQTTAPTGFPATILRYAYESSGAAITIAGDSRLFSSGFEVVVAAASCSASDVQTTLTAAPDGATVSIPAGDCDWGASQVTRNAGIRIKGAGRNLTTIRRTAPITQDGVFVMVLDCANGKSVELSDIRFIGNDDLQTDSERLQDNDNGVVLSNGCIDFKVHDMEFSKFSNAGLTIRGYPQRGIVYRSDFISNFKCQPTPVDCLGYGVVVYGDGTEPSLALGTRDAVFIEDSYFHDNRHGIASNYGSRYVLRHNTLVSTQRTRDFGIVDAHGRQSGSSAGSRSWEIYANVLTTDPPSMIATGIGIRGGDGVIFDNQIGRMPHTVVFSNESCTGVYPLPDQIREAYIWSNIWQPIPGYDQNSIFIEPGCESYIVAARDFFATPRPAYTSYVYPHPLR